MYLKYLIIFVFTYFLVGCNTKPKIENEKKVEPDKLESSLLSNKNISKLNIDKRFFQESKNLVSIKKKSIISDSLIALIYSYLDGVSLPHSKKFYLNALSFIYSIGHYDYMNQKYLTEEFYKTFPNKDSCILIVKRKLVFRKLGDYYFLYVPYPKFNISEYVGYSYVIFDKNGDIITDYMEFGGKYCCDVLNRKIDILDWNGDNEEEIVVNFIDPRRNNTAIHEDVYKFDTKTKELKNIFKFDKMFYGPENPFKNDIFFRDTANYQIISPNLIVAHFKYERIFIDSKGNRKTKKIEEYDYDIPRDSNGIYLNKNFTSKFWNDRRKLNILYNPQIHVTYTKDDCCKN